LLLGRVNWTVIDRPACGCGAGRAFAKSRSLSAVQGLDEVAPLEQFDAAPSSLIDSHEAPPSPSLPLTPIKSISCDGPLAVAAGRASNLTGVFQLGIARWARTTTLSPAFLSPG